MTTLQPVAPLQPWDWQYDWGFLTQWPVGYSLAVWAGRRITGAATLSVCQGISIAACTLALVGWFLWVRRMSPPGAAGTLLALVAAGCSVTIDSLINPSTDVVVAAAVPWILCLVHCAISPGLNGQVGRPASPPRAGSTAPQSSSEPSNSAARGGFLAQLFWAGLLAGGLFWIRYAAVFLPLGLILYLLGRCCAIRRRRSSAVSKEWANRRATAGSSNTTDTKGSGCEHPRSCVRGLAAFAIGAAIPTVVLIGINGAFGAGSTQAQMNLGHEIGFHLTAAMFEAVWRKFTSFGFYDHLAISQWLFALWPAVVLVAMAIVHRKRQSGPPSVREATARAGWWLSACTVGGLFVLLLGVTSVFGDKFAYVGLDRYYRPVKPLYFVLFASPVLWWIDDTGARAARRTITVRHLCRIVACLILLMACSWQVRYQWARTYRRWLAADRERTPSGWWARCFTPGASELYAWIDSHGDDSLIIVSNFHEFLALETGLPTVPIPHNRAMLNSWVARIRTARGITEPRVLFVLDRENRWRDYWQPEPARVVEEFGLERLSECGDLQGGCVYRYEGSTPG